MRMKTAHRSTPAAIVALLVAASGAAQAQSVFSDMPDNHWAASAVKTLSEAEIIEGYSASNNATRKERPGVTPAKLAATMAKVKGALKQEERLDATDINVSGSTETSTITLTGTVNSKLERDWAGQIAAQNASDFKIVNRLRVAAKARGR